MENIQFSTLGMSTRLRNALACRGISTLAQFIEFGGMQQMRKEPGIGIGMEGEMRSLIPGIDQITGLPEPKEQHPAPVPPGWIAVKLWLPEIGPEQVFIYTSMPVLPKEGDSVGFWVDGKWRIEKVTGIIYEFTEDNTFLCVEIGFLDAE